MLVPRRFTVAPALLAAALLALVLALGATTPARAQEPADTAAEQVDPAAPPDEEWAEEDEVDWNEDYWEPQEAPAPAPPPAPTSTPAPTPAAPPLPPLATTRTVPGRQVLLRRDGRAAIPRRAPARVKAVIAAANQIIGKPYKWGGGHARLIDRGYDCSGAVSYALIRAGMLPYPLVSGTFARWASPNPGRWISIYANKGHVYMEVAGLRLDTSSVGDFAYRPGVRWRPVIGRRAGFRARHPAGL